MNKLDQSRTRYLSYLKNERGYSAHTVQAYDRSLVHLIDFLLDLDENIKDWPQVTESHLKSWLATFRKQQLKPSSIQAKTSSIKGFFNFLF